jgi:hypothetical protein
MWILVSFFRLFDNWIFGFLDKLILGNQDIFLATVTRTTQIEKIKRMIAGMLIAASERI